MSREDSRPLQHKGNATSLSRAEAVSAATSNARQGQHRVLDSGSFTRGCRYAGAASRGMNVYCEGPLRACAFWCQNNMGLYTQTQRDRERERETERKADRHTWRETQRQTQRDTERDRQTETVILKAFMGELQADGGAEQSSISTASKGELTAG